MNDSFTALYLQLKDAVLHNALAICRDTETAKDIRQEVFVRLWKMKEDLDRIADIDDYVFIVTRNLSLTYYGRKKREQIGRDNFEQHYRQFYPPSEKNRYDDARYQGFYNKAIQSLPARQKEVYILHRIHGYTRMQIAASLNVSISTVKVSYKDAEKNIFRKLNACFL